MGGFDEAEIPWSFFSAFIAPLRFDLREEEHLAAPGRTVGSVEGGQKPN
jgi:hypothetical protein